MLGTTRADSHHFIGPLWYFSALLIVVLLVYPLARKWRHAFPCIMAPLLAMFCFGNYVQRLGYIGNLEWFGFVYSGMLRAVGGVCIGFLLSYFAQQRRSEGKCGGQNRAAVCVTVMAALIAASFWVMNVGYQWSVTSALFCVPLFSLMIWFAFEWQTLFNRIVPGRLSAFLGEFSVALYVGHIVPLPLINTLPIESWSLRYACYLMISGLFGLLVYLLSIPTRKILKRIA